MGILDDAAEMVRKQQILSPMMDEMTVTLKPAPQAFMSKGTQPVPKPAISQNALKKVLTPANAEATPQASTTPVPMAMEKAAEQATAPVAPIASAAPAISNPYAGFNIKQLLESPKAEQSAGEQLAQAFLPLLTGLAGYGLGGVEGGYAGGLGGQAGSEFMKGQQQQRQLAAEKAQAQKLKYFDVMGDLAGKGLKADESGAIGPDITSPIYQSRAMEPMVKLAQIQAMFGKEVADKFRQDLDLQKEARAAKTEKERLDIDKQKLALEQKKAAQELANKAQKLPHEKQLLVDDYTKQLSKTSVSKSQVEQLLKQTSNKNIKYEDRLATAQEQLKLLNSTLGADAVGAEEVSRLAAYLDPFPNWVKKMPGTDLDSFNRQLERVIERTKGTIDFMSGEISKITGRPSAGQSQYEPGTIKGGYKFKGGDPTKQENWEKVK